MGVSSLVENIGEKMETVVRCWRGEGSYLGLMLSIFSPELDLTNSLLMKRPIGCSYLRPLGAVSETKRSDMSALVDDLTYVKSAKFSRICCSALQWLYLGE